MVQLCMRKAETSTASSEPAKQKRSQSRPDNCIHPRENIEVAVKGKELTLRTTSKDFQADEVIFKLECA